mmetsp:Transcript_49869/g.139577  ORF Transcript_49869/g.139577 Transcript_49869/m.139577 type:complete len:329 (-) Transcript_49869:177-1163(-)
MRRFNSAWTSIPPTFSVCIGSYTTSRPKFMSVFADAITVSRDAALRRVLKPVAARHVDSAMPHASRLSKKSSVAFATSRRPALMPARVFSSMRLKAASKPSAYLSAGSAFGHISDTKSWPPPKPFRTTRSTSAQKRDVRRSSRSPSATSRAPASLVPVEAGVPGAGVSFASSLKSFSSAASACPTSSSPLFSFQAAINSLTSVWMSDPPTTRTFNGAYLKAPSKLPRLLVLANTPSRFACSFILSSDARSPQVAPARRRVTPSDSSLSPRCIKRRVFWSIWPMASSTFFRHATCKFWGTHCSVILPTSSFATVPGPSAPAVTAARSMR